VSTIDVSSTEEVLERLRVDLVAEMEGRRISVPPAAKASGNWFDAVVAWRRLEHRTVPARPRSVSESAELCARLLEPATQAAVRQVQGECERGEDLTHRFTRQFYKSGFNDFLFNNFGIHHLHLGAPLDGQDKTRDHLMAGSTSELLFALVTPSEAFFLDVLDHRVFTSVEGTKSLARIALRNRPDLLRRFVAPGVVGADQTFEDAFAL
jgi:hypothetical protein